ncbi:uncharacterized protein LOC143297687 [Babylonia areolata]|uniref:uncharacterized protein LOC143297687 n=1 Tax=Babylonia areolata TaxID=304850 RepID=UPI003FD38C43
MTTSGWSEEGSLADMKHRLERLRTQLSRQKIQEQEPGKKDTLKILQSKFGTPVYDPDSPAQQAYERSCSRSGRRKSYEFEDLHQRRRKPSLQQSRPDTAVSRKISHDSATPYYSAPTRNPSHQVWRSSAQDIQSQTSHLSSPHQFRTSLSFKRTRNTSDPMTNHRRVGGRGGGGVGLNDHSIKARHVATTSTNEHGGQQKVGQGEAEGKELGQSQMKGGRSVRVSGEERRVTDRRLVGGGEEWGATHYAVTAVERRRKISKGRGGGGGGGSGTNE